MGEALYQLKYRHDFDQVIAIADQLSGYLSVMFKSASFVVPMPPSRYRARQPVVEIAKRLAANMAVPCLENLLLKNAQTGQMKDINTKEEKVEALCKKIYFDDVLGDGLYDVLVVDDLYDTGASLEAATIVLQKYEKIRNIYVVTVTRKR